MMKLLQAYERRFCWLVAFFAFTLAFVCNSARGQVAPEEQIHGMVGVGTWKTQAEFKDILVTKGTQTLFASDFSQGLQGWKTTRGQWQVVDGALRQTSNEENAQAVVGNPNWSNYTLTLKARKLGGDEGFLIFFGMPDENARSRWNVGGWGNTGHGIQAPATSSAQVPGKIETGRWYDIKVELSGNTIRTYLDGQLIQSATQSPATHTLVFNTQARGEKKNIAQWGLDTSWPSADNMIRGIAYMGRDQVDIVRVAFPISSPLVNGELSAKGQEEVDIRARIALLAGNKPWTMMPHQEGGVDPWFKNGNQVILERWVQAMAASQRRYGKKLASVEAFNEPDYGWNQGTLGNLNDILGLLRANPDFAGVQMSGPSTLNSDAADRWYQPLKSRLDRATTHALGGNMDSYINFFRQAKADGKIADNPEPHDLAEVIAGAEYGLQSAIWWATAEKARGEFVKASDGERLAYAEDRPRWSAAAVYRAPDGKLQAFAGSSERQGETTNYRFVSQDRPVFFNGDGPRREFTMPVRRHEDIVLNITWGQDVQPKVGGKYVIVNCASGKVLGVAGANKENGADIQQMDYTQAANQQWEVAPFVKPGGDQSYFTVRAVHSGKALDTANWKHDEGSKIQQYGDGDGTPQQWFFDYAGNNNFFIRSRWSTKCLTPAGASKDAGAAIVQTASMGTASQWRLIPVGAERIEFDAPRQPTKLKASAKTGVIQLQWKANREADVAGYTVFRSTTAQGPYDTIARGVTGTSFLDNEAGDGRRYFYKIKAVDRCLNQSSFSAPTSAGAN